MADRADNREWRVPGYLFRGMAEIYLRLNPGATRESLARRLQSHLASAGVHYHVRSVKRQLTGSVQTVPPCVQNAMRSLLLRDSHMQSTADVEFALWSAGLSASPDRRRPHYVSARRVVPLVQLWLASNPTRSKRSLAMTLSQRLADRGVTIAVDTLQSILAARRSAARREVLDELVVLLGDQGIRSEKEARIRATQHAEAIARYFANRTLLRADRLFRLALAWKVYAGEPSSRRLALMLRDRLITTGLSLSLHRIQEALDGNAKNVRAALVSETETLLCEVLPEGMDRSRAVDLALGNRTRLIDLSWVQAQPIALLAMRWLLAHPDASMRQLAIRVARSALDMGYATSSNTIQPILGGHKNRTRGFVYRAMLKQLPDNNEQVPAKHVLPSRLLKSVLPSFRIPRAADGKRSELPLLDLCYDQVASPRAQYGQ